MSLKTEILKKLFKFNFLKILSILTGSILFIYVAFHSKFIKKIRVHKIHHFLGAIQYLEIYVYEKKNGYHKNYHDFFCIDNSTKIFFYKSKKYNRSFLLFLLKLLNNKSFNYNLYNLVLNLFYVSIFDFCSYFKLQDYLVPIHSHNFLEKNNRIQFRKINLIDLDDSFINSCSQLIKNKQNNINLIKNKLITYCNRDTSYKKYQYADINWSYHDFRNFPPENFRKTINTFLNKGYFNIRVGNVALEKLKIDNNNFIDYPFSNIIDEKIDIFLLYLSKFYVGSGSGLDKIASFMNIPIVYVNPFNIQWLPHYCSKCIAIPNKFINTLNSESITFKNQISVRYISDKKTNKPISKFTSTNEYLRNNIKIIYNSEIEINDAANELDCLINNENFMDEEDVKNQKIFWENIGQKPLSNNFFISPKFLRNNLDLLT